MRLFILSLFLFSAAGLAAQTTKDYTLQVVATSYADPARIVFDWPLEFGTTSYEIYRKTKEAVSWGPLLETLDAGAVQWIDTNVTAGEEYEYRFVKNTNSHIAYTYVLAGIAKPLVEQRGKIILVVEDSYWTELEPGVQRLESDLIGDGWQVIRLLVNRDDAVTAVKSKIVAAYQSDPTRVKSLFLLGHVPVPYSGDIYPDGHIEHQGAWSADAYYADMDGSWTDEFIFNTDALYDRNDNVPGDGKWDASILPSDLELQIGRVDLSDMPAFGQTELQLLQAYLDKDHGYRQRQFEVARRGVIDDHFGTANGEAFAACGWRNSPLLSADSLYKDDYRTFLKEKGAQWAYGCGPGSYTSAVGIGTTNDLVTDSLRGIFTMVFGSYFGDWDTQNNFLRAQLANKGSILSSAWAGRPHWHFHAMALGETLGYSALKTQNNPGTYFSNYGARFVHVALMGDPTLRQDMIDPPKDLLVGPGNDENQNLLQWTASSDPVSGYYVYRADSLYGVFERISGEIIAGTTYTDACPKSGQNVYMVRALRLEKGYSGTYFNQSQACFGSSFNENTFVPLETPEQLCAGAAYEFGYTFSGPDCSGNQFMIELSEAGGNFEEPALLGSATPQANGILDITIPDSTFAATEYKIRIRSLNPAYIFEYPQLFSIFNKAHAEFSAAVNGNTVQLENLSKEASEYTWIVDDSIASAAVNPQFNLDPGSHTIVLVASNTGCTPDTFGITLIITGSDDLPVSHLQLAPNPVGDVLYLQMDQPLSGRAVLEIIASDGHTVLQDRQISNARIQGGVAIANLQPGVYIIRIRDEGRIRLGKFVKAE